MATASKNQRRLNLNAAQSANPIEKNDKASLPNAEDQKLTEGKNTIAVANRRKLRDLYHVTSRKAASKAIRPIAPNIWKTRKQPRNERLKPWVKKDAKNRIAAVPKENPKSGAKL